MATIARKMAMALAVLSLIGCGGRAASSESEAVPSPMDQDPVVIPPVSTVDAAGWTTLGKTVRADLAPLCAADTGGIRAVDSDADAAALLVGTWWVCSSPSAFGGNDVGVAIFADGTWNRLYADGGAVTVGQGPEDRGQWVLGARTTVNGDTTCDVGMVLPQGGGNGFSVSFANSMLKMHVENMSFYRADYVRDDSAAPTAVSHSTYAAIDPAPVCAAPVQGTVTPPTADALRATMVGQWLSCGGSVFCSTDEVGFELTPDGSYYKLYAAGPGRVRRGSSFGQTGRWGVTDYSAMGENMFQVGFDNDVGGGIIPHPTFAASPRRMHLDNNGVCIADYVLNPQ